VPYYRRRKRGRRLAAAAVALAALAATAVVAGLRPWPSGGGADPAPTVPATEPSFPAGFTPGSVTATTTDRALTGWNAFGVSAETLLGNLAEAVGAVDKSFISRSKCGLYAMLVTPVTVNLFLFDGSQWTDQSVLLGAGRGDEPTGVVTRDFTNDGVLDFLVLYRGESGGRSTPYGAVFAYPWPEERMCEWNWVSVDDGRGQSGIIDEPIVERRKTSIFGDGYRGRWQTYGRFDYDPSRHMFVFTALPGD